MSDVIHTSSVSAQRRKLVWEAKRDIAIKRFVSAWEKYQTGDDPDEVNSALDVVTVAHLATAFELPSRSPNS